MKSEPTFSPEIDQKPAAVSKNAEIFLQPDGRVLKLFFDWYPVSEVEREAKVARSVYEAGLPVPKFDDVMIIENRLGMIYEHVTGIDLFTVLHQQPWRIISLARQFAKTQQAINQQEIPDLPALKDYLCALTEKNQFLSPAVKKKLVKHLDRVEKGDTLCHGAYFPENFLFTDSGPRVIGWMFSVSGNCSFDRSITQVKLKLLEQNDRWNPILTRLFSGLYRMFLGKSASEVSDEPDLWTAFAAEVLITQSTTSEREVLYEIIRKKITRK